MNTFQKKANVKSRSRDIFRGMEIRFKKARRCPRLFKVVGSSLSSTCISGMRTSVVWSYLKVKPKMAEIELGVIGSLQIFFITEVFTFLFN